MKITFLLTALALLSFPLSLLAQTSVPPEQVHFFETKIRPVLAAKCFSCHGPKKQSGGLRLDSRTAILEENEHGVIVVPGKAAKSLLPRVLNHTGKIKMPPKEKLPPSVLADVTAWINMGAPWPATPPLHATATSAWKNHWAVQPLIKPSVPTPKQRTPIDAFILAQLEAKHLTPSPQADPRTLIRRLTFDLIGLPPTPEEIDAFLADSALSTQHSALENLVDRLLASPHYGERWGRHWLDVARYADTKGYVFFEEQDFPWSYTYRDYVIRSFNEDLPYDRFILEQLAADQLPLGTDQRALTALGFLTLGGRFMSNQHDILDDRIDVVSRGLQGMTLTCARCHDHKFDPITMKDYYALYGVFASCAEPAVPPLFEPAPTTEVYTKFAKELKLRKEKLTDFVKAKHAELVTNARRRVAEYLLAAHALRDQPSTDDFMLITNTNDLNPTMIARWQRFLQRTAKTHDRVFAPWHDYPHVPNDKPLNSLLLKAIKDQPPRSRQELAQRYASVLLAVDQKWQALAKDKNATRLADPDEEELRQIFYGPNVPANVAVLPYGDLSLLPDRPSQAKLQELRKALEKWRSTGPGAPPRAHALEDLPTPFAPYVFLRGNPNRKGEAVPRRIPALLTGGKAQPIARGSGRLELARAIASKDNPLTARVLVNRLWQHHFGVGLVRTPSDFGLRSEPPSHPQLLDFLAATFIENGWSIKKLHRMIVLSSVYLQKSADRSDCAAADPENRLLWKMTPQRLDFEATRDALLAVAGRLDRKLGGRSVRDPLANAANRRTVYSFVDRLNVSGLFRTFDFPSPDASSPGRENTTIAPQALFLMNHPFVMECARQVMSHKDLTAEKDAGKRIDRLYALLFGREPGTEEKELARRFLAASGNTPLAWERYVHALLQTNEFVWID